ncbi:hypothetical protein AgCh_016321 [Apium graveolens]
MKGQRVGSRGPSAVIGIPLERMDEVRKERKAKPTNCWTLGDIKTYWEVSIGGSIKDPSFLRPYKHPLKLLSESSLSKEDHKKDMEMKSAKITQAEEDKNVDAWLDAFQHIMSLNA